MMTFVGCANPNRGRAAWLSDGSDAYIGTGARLQGWTVDLDAAVRWAARGGQWAVVSKAESPAGGWRYELTNARDEPGWVEVSPVSDGADPQRFTGEAFAGLGRFGDPPAERRFEQDIASRLREIAEMRER